MSLLSKIPQYRFIVIENVLLFRAYSHKQDSTEEKRLIVVFFNADELNLLSLVIWEHRADSPKWSIGNKSINVIK